MLYGVMDQSLTARSTSGLAANFHAADREFTAASKQLVDRGLDLLAEVTRALVPVRTGFMRDHVRKTKSPGGLTGSVGWHAEDFLNAGLAFYPPFVEFGTRFMAAQPSLGPAYAYVTPIVQQEARDLFRVAIERIGRRGRAR